MSDPQAAAAAAVARIEAGRRLWVELEPGRRVQFRRPGPFKRACMGPVSAEAMVLGWAVAWEGFTQRDVNPDGSTAALPFQAALWAALVEDRVDWGTKCLAEVVAALEGADQQEAADAKNSPPSSTPSPSGNGASS